MVRVRVRVTFLRARHRLECGPDDVRFHERRAQLRDEGGGEAHRRLVRIARDVDAPRNRRGADRGGGGGGDEQVDECDDRPDITRLQDHAAAEVVERVQHLGHFVEGHSTLLEHLALGLGSGLGLGLGLNHQG
eukprot:scaffold28721_cov40-Phaeocystis_antarctica.AAC.2